MRRMRAMQITILAALMMRRSLCRMAAQFYHLGVGRSRWTLKNGEKRPFYTNKISRLALTLPIFDRFGKMGYQIDPLVKPDSKHSLLFLEGSNLGPFTYLKGTVLKGHYRLVLSWKCRRHVGDVSPTCQNVADLDLTCVSRPTFLVSRHFLW